MKRIQKFYKCNSCGNIVGVINNTGIPMYCCRQEMEELIPHHVEYSNFNGLTSQILDFPSEETSSEKSKIFRIKKDDDKNSVSLIIDKNYLSDDSSCWAYLKTQKGGQRKNLLDKNTPVLDFKVVDDNVISAYFYCSNLGLFKMDF